MKKVMLAIVSILCIASCASKPVCEENDKTTECSKKTTIQERTTPRGGVY